MRLAADSGNVRAQRKSVTLPMKGHEVEGPHEYIREIMEKSTPRDSIEAKKWLNTEESIRIDQILDSTVSVQSD